MTTQGTLRLPEKILLQCWVISRRASTGGTFQIYLLFFYTDVFGIPLPRPARCCLLPACWTGAIDPAMGIDRRPHEDPLG